MSSRLTERISGSSVSTIPTLRILGKTLSFPSTLLFCLSYEPSWLKLRNSLGVVIRPSQTSLFVIWSMAAFEGAQIRIFFFSSKLATFFKYSYSAARRPMRVVVLPVPGGPWRRTIPDSLRTISRMDSYWVALYSDFNFCKMGSNCSRSLS